MKYLKHVLLAIERLDYVRFEYAAMLAILLEDGGTASPRDLARPCDFACSRIHGCTGSVRTSQSW